MFFKLPILPYQYRSISQEKHIQEKIRSESLAAHNRTLRSEHFPVMGPNPYMEGKYFSLNNSPSSEKEGLNKTKSHHKLEMRVSQLKEEVEGLLELNNKLIRKQEFKDKELQTYRRKLQSQREEIKDWEQKYKQLEKEHINEIAVLKSNLNNSIIVEEEEEKKDNGSSQGNQAMYSFSNKCDENVQMQIKILREENEVLKDQLENDELKEKIGFIEKSLNESLKNLENENKRLKEIIDLNNLDKQKEIQEKLESIEIPNDDSDPSLLNKINRMINWIQEMELELEEWKRNYWILEKKINHYELKEEQFNLKNNEEIEIEYDFTNNQIMQTTKQNTQNTLQEQLDDYIQKNQHLESTIKVLEQQLNQKEDQKKKQSTLSNKDLLQKIITQQRKQIATYFVRGYTRPQIIPSTRISPIHAPVQNLNLTSHSPLSKNYYSYTPILIKQSSQSPVHYKNQQLFH